MRFQPVRGLPLTPLFQAYVRQTTKKGVSMRISSALLIGTSMLAVAAPAFAQTGQEAAAQAANEAAGPHDQGAIIITAQKRLSTVQDTPFSVNAQTQADIQRANANTL